MQPLNPALVGKLYARAGVARWGVSVARFSTALEAAAGRELELGATEQELDGRLSRLHLEDLALACACADGSDTAWEHFVRQHRPALYSAADALAPGGAARELADALFAELFGVRDGGRARQSLFHYFHGRSSLSTWLRAILAQRHVDAVRSRRRFEPLADIDTAAMIPAAVTPDREKYLVLMGTGLASAVARLSPRDRLRLALYYGQQLKLAQIGRVLHEHEATVSRQLARSRDAVRANVIERLRAAGLDDEEVRRCLDSVMEDAGPLDLGAIFGEVERRNSSAPDRSK